MQPLHLLIPPERTIVVLDTSPARNIAHESGAPAWVATFASMSNNEYSFSLADNAFAELITQIATGAIAKDGADRMLQQLKTFLNPNLPILPGKRDILALIGSEDKAPDWNIDQVRDLALRSWECLNRAIPAADNEPLNAEEELSDEREEWFAIFDCLGSLETGEDPLNEYRGRQLETALRSLDNRDISPSPPLSVRMDLQVRLLWRQYVRSKRQVERYDPRFRKKKNDGIDFDLYRYFLLPALVVATDSGFFEKIADIASFQKSWFWRPEKLAQAWLDGEKPRAVWPT